jgi:heat shock protein HslJ
MPAGRHFHQVEGVAAAAANLENVMIDIRLVAGRSAFVCGATLAVTLGLAGPNRAGEPFPFDQELVLDVRPMPPVKRVPVLSVSTNGNARIDLWCQTVSGQVELAGRAIRIEPAPLPDALPQYMIEGQCTPDRMQADAATLAALAQVTDWRRQASAIVLVGPQTLKFRPSDH